MYIAGPIGDAARNAYEAGSRLGELEHAATTGGWIERRHGRRHLPDAASTAADAEDRLAGLIDAERSRLNDEIGHLQARLDILDQHSTTGLERWQQAAGQHAVAARGQRRLGRVVETARRRLEQTDRRDRPTRRRARTGRQLPPRSSSPSHPQQPTRPQACDLPTARRRSATDDALDVRSRRSRIPRRGFRAASTGLVSQSTAGAHNAGSAPTVRGC